MDVTLDRTFTTVHDRYAIGHHLEGFIDTAMTLADAQKIAERWEASNHGYEKGGVCIFDRLANRGQPQKWGLVRGEWLPLSFRH